MGRDVPYSQSWEGVGYLHLRCFGHVKSDPVGRIPEKISRTSAESQARAVATSKYNNPDSYMVQIWPDIANFGDFGQNYTLPVL